MLIGILQGYTLVGEQTYLVVEQRYAYPMIVFRKYKGMSAPTYIDLGLFSKPAKLSA